MMGDSPQEQESSDAERRLALLLHVLTDADFTKQRQAEGDPWVYRAPNPTWPNVRLYKNEPSVLPDVLKMGTFGDPKLLGAILDSVKRGTGRYVAGFYDRPTNTVFAPYDKDIIQHELQHFFNPQWQHPLFETVDEWKNKRLHEVLPGAGQ